MADLKISALTGAATPLAGTEVLPIVQSGTTKKVSVDNLTAGKTVNAANFVLSGDAAIGTAITAGLKLSIRGATTSTVIGCDNGVNTGFVVKFAPSLTNIGNDFSQPLGFLVNNIQQAKLEASGDLTLNFGNLVQGTAAKGINFTANTPAAGMTSQLLNWYEEGTWTPNQGAGLIVVGTFSSSGKYTRIGRQVTVAGQFNATTSVSAAASAICCTNLPFSAATECLGSMTDAAVSASSTCLTSAANLYVITAIAATTTIYFSVTYFV